MHLHAHLSSPFTHLIAASALAVASLHAVHAGSIDRKLRHESAVTVAHTHAEHADRKLVQGDAERKFQSDRKLEADRKLADLAHAGATERKLRHEAPADRKLAGLAQAGATERELRHEFRAESVHLA